MKAWLILTKFCIVVYVALLAVEDSARGLGPIVLFLLIFMSLNSAMYIFEKKKMQQSFLNASLIILIICSIIISPIFYILFTMNLFEFINMNKLEKWLGISISVIIMFFLDLWIVKAYALIGMLSYIITELCYNNEERLLKLRDENDNLKFKNYKLNQNLIKDTEYQLQLKHMSQTEERNKIAQEIHDSIGHTISGSLMQLEAIKFIMNKDINKAEEMLQNTIDVLREGMESIRSTLRNIKPPPEQLGVNRLKLILDEFEINSKIKANLFYEGNLNKISYEQWSLVNNNVKEALTNTMKYSKASQVKVKIEILNKLIKVEIKDDGVGSLRIVKGLGIKGMEERCSSLDGKLIVDGSRGFSIIMLLPI